MGTIQNLYRQALEGWAAHFAGERIHCMCCGDDIQLPVVIDTLVPEFQCAECGSVYIVDPVLVSITYDVRTTRPEVRHTIVAR